MQETPETLLEEASELLDALAPILQRNIEALQHDPNPLLQHLVRREVEYQEGLLQQIEKVKGRVQEHLKPPDIKPRSDGSKTDLLQNDTLRPSSYPPGGPLGVTMSDGSQIRRRYGSTTLVEAIKEIGIENVDMIGLMSHSIPLISATDYSGTQQTRVGKYYIAVNTSTTTKIELLKEIALQLAIPLKADDLS